MAECSTLIHAAPLRAPTLCHQQSVRGYLPQSDDLPKYADKRQELLTALMQFARREFK
jgi:hypothetical protein